MYKQNLILAELLGPVVSSMGYELLGVESSSTGGGSLLRVYIDNEAGITLDDCGRVSEQVSGVLDVNDPVQGAYRLEISSPGIARPLFTLEQFKRFTGQQARVKLYAKLEGRKNFTGKIKAVNQQSVVMLADGNEIVIPADMIEKAQLWP